MTAQPFSDVPPRPPFDPDLIPGLTAIRQAMPGLSAETLLDYRRMLQEGIPGREPHDLTAAGAIRLEDREVPGPVGAPDITVLILSPAERPATPVPAIYYVHGGGMVVGHRRMGVEEFLPLVAEGRAVVVSIEYRLAPEHPDPTPVDDCYAGLVWTAKNAAELGIDPDQLIVAGTSAGAGLAAGIALLARDRAFPQLSHQILWCPMLDDRFDTVSSRMLDREGLADRNDNLYSWTSLLGDRRGGPDVSQYAAPARAVDLSGLPRTYIDVGSVDSFRDEALIYARRLSEAGVTVDFHMWGGGFHGFNSILRHVPISQAANVTREEFLRRALKA